MASPQVGTDAFQASGGSDQINMTTTIELSSLSNEEQKQIVEKFSSELKVGSEDKNILIDGKQVNSIVLDLRVSSSIFKDTEALRSALMALVWEVVDKGKIDTTIQDTVYVTLTFNSPLSSQESGVLSGVLTPKMLEIADGESEGRIHDSTFGNSTFTPHATQELYWGDLGSKPGASKDDKQGETYSCKSCQQKDIQISELKKNNGKLEENIWILHRFLDSNDQNIDKHHEVLSTICREEIQTTVTQKRSNARLHGEDQSRVIDSKLTESEQRVCQTVIPSQGRLKDKLKADLIEEKRILTDEVMDMKTELKELKTSLIGYIDKQKVDLVMNTDQIEKSIESPENRKVHITATVNQTHVTADTENEIIENLPPEIKIQANNDTLSEAHFLKSMGVSDKRDF